jgi:hypothetical protein
MILCIVAECPNLEDDSRGFCSQHLKRWLAGQVYEDENGQLVDHCIKDHALVGDNVRWESSGKSGKKRRRCRECLRLKAQRQAKNALTVVEIPQPYRPQDLTLTQAIRDFNDAQEVAGVDAKCKDNPGPYMDWDEDSIPTRERAAELCSGCPFLRACGNHAIAAQEPHGIWGGRVVHEGVWLG